jgi:hypothetical protein
MREKQKQDPETGTHVGIGRRLERLGQRLQDPEASVRELAGLAEECGLEIQFRVVKRH